MSEAPDAWVHFRAEAEPALDVAFQVAGRAGGLAPNGLSLSIGGQPLAPGPNVLLAEGHPLTEAGGAVGFSTDPEGDWACGEVGGPDGACWRRHVLFARGGALLLVDEVEAAVPVRWTWQLVAAGALELRLHARRIDLPVSGASARLYLLQPEGTRTTLSDAPNGVRLAVETTQRTRATRFISVLLADPPGEAPIPHRFAGPHQVGLTFATPRGPRTLAARLGGDGELETDGGRWRGAAVLMGPGGQVLLDADPAA